MVLSELKKKVDLLLSRQIRLMFEHELIDFLNMYKFVHCPSLNE